MNRTILICVSLCLTLVSSVFGQARIRGEVRDADTQETLTGATIQIDGTLQGAVTNEQGRFYLILDRLPATVTVRFIGYRTRIFRIESVEDRDIQIVLEPVTLELDEVVVSGEDPAVGIMREVLARKQEWRSSLSTAYAEVYTRFWLYRQFDPIQVIESIRSSYWKPESGSRELIRATRPRPVGIGTFRFAGPEYVPNFYDDEVDVSGSWHAGPTHPDALDIYRFRLGESNKLDDAIVWEIYFTPVSGTRSAFSGRMAVLDSVFAILEIEARPSPGTVFMPPVQSYDVRYEQHFAALPGGARFPLDLRATGSVTIGRLGASYPPARFEQLSSLSNYAVNGPLPDSMFTDQRTQRLHPLADHQDFLFIRNPTISPLTPREAEALASLNPRMTIERAFRPEGLLRQYTAVNVTTESEDENDAPTGIVDHVLSRSWVWYNRVDGWHPGLQWSHSLRSGPVLSANLGYATEREQFSGGLGLEVPWQVSSFSGSIISRAVDETASTAGPSEYGLFVPGLMTYAGYDDYFDYYRRRAVSLGASIGTLSEVLALELSLNFESHGSQSRNSRHKGWLFKKDQRENPAIEDGQLTSLLLKIGSSLGGTGALSVEIEHAPKNILGSDFDFTTFRGRLALSFRTLFRDRERPNLLRLQLVGATSVGTPPIQRYGLIDGSTGPISRPGTFRTLDDRSVRGYRYAAFFWEHDFTTALMERLGFWRVADSGLGIILFGGHGRVFDGPAASNDNNWRHELGLGFAYPFRLPVRLDFATRLDRPGLAFRMGLTSF